LTFSPAGKDEDLIEIVKNAKKNKKITNIVDLPAPMNYIMRVFAVRGAEASIR